MENEELREPDLLELSDEEGNTLLMAVRNYFFYNGEEYAALQEADEDGSVKNDDLYVMKVVPTTGEDGEELEEFLPPEEELLETLLRIAELRFSPEGNEAETGSEV
ncbi:MAG: DUF1292 domain-containing protein [Clostridiales bacterium]|nr:DUF1292 domain-containing protein [Clostridiales bacterium]